MNIKIPVASILLLAFFSLTVSAQRSWKDLVVMKSLRTHVVSVLGESSGKSVFETYKIKAGTLNIQYSYGKCGDKSNSGWNIPEDSVIEIEYTPNKSIKFSSLKVNLEKFKKLRESPDVPQIISYVNEEDGIKYVVQYNGELDSVAYFPSLRYKNLKCGD